MRHSSVEIHRDPAGRLKKNLIAGTSACPRTEGMIDDAKGVLSIVNVTRTTEKYYDLLNKILGSIPAGSRMPQTFQ